MPHQHHRRSLFVHVVGDARSVDGGARYAAEDIAIAIDIANSLGAADNNEQSEPGLTAFQNYLNKKQLHGVGHLKTNELSVIGRRAVLALETFALVLQKR